MVENSSKVLADWLSFFFPSVCDFLFLLRTIVPENSVPTSMVVGKQELLFSFLLHTRNEMWWRIKLKLCPLHIYKVYQLHKKESGELNIQSDRYLHQNELHYLGKMIVRTSFMYKEAPVCIKRTHCKSNREIQRNSLRLSLVGWSFKFLF